MPFRWESVDPTLLRQLLAAAAPERHRRRGESLAAFAAEVFGRRLTARQLETAAMLELLRGDWLRRADPAVAEGLAQRRDSTARTRRAQLAFVAALPPTAALRADLARAFTHAHSSSAPGSPTAPTVMLIGAGSAPGRVYPIHTAAGRRLDSFASSRGRRAGLVVLPAGAGRTRLVVGWTLRRLALDPRLRVLWIVSQPARVEPVVAAFTELAATEPPGFRRRLGHAGSAGPHRAGPPLAGPHLAGLDVAVVTWPDWSRVARFLTRPSIVVVDEASHALDPAAATLLDRVQANRAHLLVGLTASLPTDRARLPRFPRRIVEATVQQLADEGVLARPVAHTIGGPVDDDLLVKTWLTERDTWGATLVYAADTHAAALAARFAAVGADEVSVVTEVVDRPGARTLVLAAPIQRRSRLRALVVPFLRGPLVGGAPTTHLVAFHDPTSLTLWDDPSLWPNLCLTAPGAAPVVPPRLLAAVERAGAADHDSVLAGYLDMDTVDIPVFEHARGDLAGPSQLAESPPPRPAPTELASLRAAGFAPMLTPLRVSLSLRSVADELAAQPAMTDAARREWLRAAYGASPVGQLFASFRHFREAVDREVDDRGSFDPERSLLDAGPAAPLLPADADDRLLVQLGRVASVLDGLEATPMAAWTRSAGTAPLAYLSPGADGEPVIMVNRGLHGRAEVTDELLRFLLWHELVHVLRPGRGHDAAFREVESRWPSPVPDLAVLVSPGDHR